MSPAGPSRPEDGVIVEHRRSGQWLKVSVVCTRTGLEASAAGPAREPGAVERLAVAKLLKLIEAAG
ncbi:MAG: hypothetical protein K1X35_02105 [Caulobacteraceae bacterium]|nr:hypothetical protein [Caulobacteraceae bacterium]